MALSQPHCLNTLGISAESPIAWLSWSEPPNSEPQVLCWGRPGLAKKHSRSLVWWKAGRNSVHHAGWSPPIEVLLMWMLGKTLKTPPYEYYSSFHIYHKTTLKPLICFNCTLSFWGPCETERLGMKDRSIGRFWTASHELIMREWGPVCEIAKLVKMTIYMILQTS